jgi:hypothetical protein
MLPARIAVDGDALVLLSEPGAEPVKVVWPAGWAAWRVNGRAELVSRNGRLIGREGDLAPSFGGGIAEDDAFHVCDTGA